MDSKYSSVYKFSKDNNLSTDMMSDLVYAVDSIVDKVFDEMLIGKKEIFVSFVMEERSHKRNMIRLTAKTGGENIQIEMIPVKYITP